MRSASNDMVEDSRGLVYAPVAPTWSRWTRWYAMLVRLAQTCGRGMDQSRNLESTVAVSTFEVLYMMTR